MADSLQFYLNQVGKYPLLTAEQEIQLSRRIFRWLALKEEPGERTESELREMRSGKRAKEKFVRHNLRLVVTVAKKYMGKIEGTSMELDDLIQEGYKGLDRACEKFDGTLGYKFSTYAYWWIRQAIVRAIATQVRMIYVPHGTLQQMKELFDYKAEFAAINNCQPTLNELSEYFNRPIEQILLWEERILPHTSLDRLCHDDGSSLVSQIPDKDNALSDLNDEVRSPSLEKLEYALEQLTDREYEIISKKYFSKERVTLVDIGGEVGLCRETVRKILRNATEKLKSLTSAE
jgi:RNA polymerase primary sigma factor